MKTNGEKLGALTCYGHSKLANVLFAKKLAQLYPSITSTSVHPGTVSSEIWSKSDGARIMM
jgi:NAD(P)-dependent dehydrogenase (short-subunit alcohol dehydrogenase family)